MENFINHNQTSMLVLKYYSTFKYIRTIGFKERLKC